MTIDGHHGFPGDGKLDFSALAATRAFAGLGHITLLYLNICLNNTRMENQGKSINAVSATFSQTACPDFVFSAIEA
jgi:hypothetical protein